jgi:hypothetical protein
MAEKIITDRINELEQPRKEIFKFLKKKGWNVVLVGKTAVVENQNNRGEGKYWFIMEFLGAKKNGGDENG